MVSEHMVKLGMNRNIMREIFEHGKRRAKVVGAGNVLDFSLGKPQRAAPGQGERHHPGRVGRAVARQCPRLYQRPWRPGLRDAIAASLTHRFGVFCTGDELYLTVGARRRPVLLPVRPAYAGG